MEMRIGLGISEQLCKSFLEYRIWFIAIAVFFLSAPSMKAGLSADDYVHKQILSQANDWRSSLNATMQLFNFLDGDSETVRQGIENGLLPWWSHEELKVAFFRPLSAFTHWLDYRLWPDSTDLMHLQNILWYCILIFSLYRLYERLFGPSVVAFVAVFLYSLDDAHALNIGWIANRNAIISCVFGLFCINAHFRWRMDQQRKHCIYGLAFFALSLLSAEAGIATLAYILAYELCLSKETPFDQARALAPYIMIASLWLVLLKFYGFGVYASGMYTDPVANGSLYVSLLSERISLLLFGQWFYPPGSLIGLMPDQIRVAAYCLVAVALLSLLIALLPLIRHNEKARFFSLGMLLSLFPASAAFADNRQLLFIGIGAFALLALLLREWFGKSNSLPKSRFWRISVRPTVYAFLLIHVFIAPLSFPLSTTVLGDNIKKVSSTPIEALALTQHLSDKTLIFINPPIAASLQNRREDGSRLAKNTAALASSFNIPASRAMTLKRDSENSFVLQVSQGMLSAGFDQIFRAKELAFSRGQTIELSFMSAEIIEINASQQPTDVRFEFPQALESDSLVFWVWQDEQFKQINMPPLQGELLLPSIQVSL